MTARRSLTGVALGISLVAAMTSCGEDRAGPAGRGEAIAKDAGCMACHSTGESDGVGPGWGGIWGEDVELADGRTVVVDEDYLRRAITDPAVDVVAGFQLSMPIVPLDDAEVDALVAYLREVSGGGS